MSTETGDGEEPPRRGLPRPVGVAGPVAGVAGPVAGVAGPMGAGEDGRRV